MTRRVLLQSALAIAGPSGRDLQDYARRIFNRANELRVIRGAPALEWSERVAACAREQCARKEKLRFKGHEDPERGGVSERLNAAGIGWAQCAENIFQIRGYDDPVNFAIVFWWYSPGHQANMLNPEYVQTGVGVAEAEDGTFFVTQIFLAPPPARRR
jgi:uncharacterized protein YkwD